MNPMELNFFLPLIKKYPTRKARGKIYLEKVGSDKFIMLRNYDSESGDEIAPFKIEIKKSLLRNCIDEFTELITSTNLLIDDIEAL